MAESYRSTKGDAPSRDEPEAQRVAIASDDAERAAGLATLVTALVPSAHITHIDPASMKRPPEAGAVIIDGESAGLAAAERLRATGYEGALLMTVRSELSGEAHAKASRLGVLTCAEDERLGVAMMDALSRSAASPELERALSQTRRLLAAGAVALRLQHAINNPLAALLAEAQLMEMDEQDAGQRAAAGRMVELCRRVNMLVRELDGISRPRQG